MSSYSGGNETTLYVGGLLEKLTTATRTHWKHLIPTPSGQVQVIRRSDGTTDTFYVTTDHLGSTDAVLNAAGAVLMRGSFGVHGARRASNWQGAPTTTEWQAIADTTRRGYTGHEQIDNVLVVHMNGRVFDPAIGRFLSADPYVDGPETTQGWNRYSYVKGRVLVATDPTGFTDDERPDVRPTMPNEPYVSQVDGIDTVTVDGKNDPKSDSGFTTPQGGTAGTGGDGNGGGGGRGEGAKCRQAWIDAGNEIADFAEALGALSEIGLKLSLAATMAGLPAGAPGMAPGLAGMATAATVGFAAATAQAASGAAHIAGGASGMNTYTATITIAFGYSLHRLLGPVSGTANSVSQRLATQAALNRQQFAGGVYDSAVMLYEDAGPQHRSCPE